MGQAIAQMDGVDHFVDPLFVAFVATEHERKPDVLIGRQGGHQVERLKDEADFLATKFGERFVFQRRQLNVVNDGCSLGQAVESGDAVHQGGLARAAGAHDGGELAGVEVNGDITKRIDGFVAFAIDLECTLR